MADKRLTAFEAGIKKHERGKDFRLSTTLAEPELPERAGALPQRLQDIARQYISARQRAGDAVLESARWLSEARQEAKHGEWHLFLDATGTSPDHAEYLIGVHAQAMVSPIFAEAVRRNFLSLSSAYELIHAPADVQDRLLATQQPITRKQIRDEKHAANSVPARSFNDATELTPEELAIVTAAGYEWQSSDVHPGKLGKSVTYHLVSKGSGLGISMTRPQLDLWLKNRAPVVRSAINRPDGSPAGLIVGQRIDPHKPDPKDPPAPVFDETDNGPRTTDHTAPSAAYNAQVKMDQMRLIAAESAITRGDLDIARTLLLQIEVKTVARDELWVRLTGKVPTVTDWWNPLRACERAARQHDWAGALEAAQRLVALFEQVQEA